jgi:hypothetical protein
MRRRHVTDYCCLMFRRSRSPRRHVSSLFVPGPDLMKPVELRHRFTVREMQSEIVYAMVTLARRSTATQK